MECQKNENRGDISTGACSQPGEEANHAMVNFGVTRKVWVVKVRRGNGVNGGTICLQ